MKDDYKQYVVLDDETWPFRKHDIVELKHINEDVLIDRRGMKISLNHIKEVNKEENPEYFL